jgi:hypothetical protein
MSRPRRTLITIATAGPDTLTCLVSGVAKPDCFIVVPRKNLPTSMQEDCLGKTFFATIAHIEGSPAIITHIEEGWAETENFFNVS